MSRGGYRLDLVKALLRSVWWLEQSHGLDEHKVVVAKYRPDRGQNSFIVQTVLPHELVVGCYSKEAADPELSTGRDDRATRHCWVKIDKSTAGGRKGVRR